MASTDLTKPANTTPVSSLPGEIREARSSMPTVVEVTASGTVSIAASTFFRVVGGAAPVSLGLPDPSADETAQHRRVTFVRGSDGGAGAVTVVGESLAEDSGLRFVSDEARWYRA
ncbi:MAG: hypothetical protein AAFP86_08455 [Planctomycetota bacterium]